MRTVPSVLRWYVESAIISGDGNGKPLGITQSPCLVSQVREDANEVNPSDFANIETPMAGHQRLVWLVNPQVAAQMNIFAVGNFPVYMPSGDMTGRPFGTLYGAPVIESEHIAGLEVGWRRPAGFFEPVPGDRKRRSADRNEHRLGLHDERPLSGSCTGSTDSRCGTPQ